MKPIFTREQLEWEIVAILEKYEHDIPAGDYEAPVNEICDLIADLNDLCFHSKSSDDRR